MLISSVYYPSSRFWYLTFFLPKQYLKLRSSFLLLLSMKLWNIYLLMTSVSKSRICPLCLLSLRKWLPSPVQATPMQEKYPVCRKRRIICSLRSYYSHQLKKKELFQLIRLKWMFASAQERYMNAGLRESIRPGNQILRVTRLTCLIPSWIRVELIHILCSGW